MSQPDGSSTSPTGTATAPNIQALAKQAYIYAYAPVYMERQRRNMISADKDMGDGRAPLNTFGWVRILATPDLKAIVMPNNDTVYGTAWVDLSKGPYVLEVPDLGSRYFTFQMMDAFSNTFDYVGTRATGDKGGRFLIAGPEWNDAAPPDIAKVITAPTSTIWIAARFGVSGAADLSAVHKVQDSIRFGPLNGRPTTAGNPHYAPLPPPEKLAANQFFSLFGEVLKAYPTPAPAQALVKGFSSIGLDPKSGFNSDSLKPDALEALEAGAREAFQAIQSAKLGDTVNGWQFSMKNGRFGEDYLLRSAIAYRSLAGNVPEEAIYFNANTDLSGQPLDGSRRYTLRFAKGQLPPVKAFWSLTMYDGKTFFLVDNAIKRYSIGDRTPGLKYGQDGSLTLVIQHDSPGSAEESNWLPAPSGSFDVHLRTYIPQLALLNGSYKLPPIERAG